jgi:nitric oxide reductase activation protein
MLPSTPEQTVHLSDVQRVLTLFTQGIAGRYLQLQAVEPDTVAGKVMAKPVLSDASHEVVALSVPKSMGGFDSYRDNLAAYRIAVLHQIGFLENGTYSFTLAGARRRMRGLPPNPKYDALGEGAPDLLRFFTLWPLPELMRTVFMTVEDLRIDTAVRRRYPGARKDLDRVLARALAGREPPEDKSLAAALLESLVRFSLGGSHEALLAGDSSGLLNPMLEAAAAVKEEKAGVYDSIRAAAVCFRMLLRASQANPTVPLPGEEGEILVNEEPGDASPSTITPQLKALRSKEVDFRGELNPELMYSESLSGFEDALDEEVRDGTDGAFGPPSRDAAQDIYEREREDAQPLGGEYAQAEERPVEVRLFLYDEWNYLEHRMLKGWCRLFERRLQGEDMAFIREVRRRHAALSYQIRRRFQFIRPEAFQRVHRVPDGEEIELDGLIEAVIDRRAGFATDERLYMRRDRALRDVAAAFLLDMSGSTGIAVPTGFFGKPGEKEEEEDPVLQWARRGLGKSAKPQARRSVIDVAKESLALMGDALQTLGDSYAIYGFSGDGRMQVDFLVAKDFDDRLSLRTWAALAAMQPQRSTRMGPAIRHAVAKLRPQPTHMKVLIIVSDGYPQDKDYGPDSSDAEYGIQDTAAALREAAAEGVQTFCITIDPAGYDYLRRMCEADRYLVIDDVMDLPEQLQKVYRALTV